MTERSVVVTGAGVFCPAFATDLDTFARALAGGGHEGDERADLPSRLTLHQARRLDRLSQLLIAAASEAAARAGLAQLVAREGDRVGVVVGTGLGCLEKTESQICGIARDGLAHADAMGFPDSMDSSPAAQLAIHLGARGPSFTLREREISGESALILGESLVATGAAEAVVVVAGDARTEASERTIRRYAPRLEVGEGAGALILESGEAAACRGTRPLCRIVAPEGVEGDALVVREEALRERIGWCPGDGVLRAIAGILLANEEGRGSVLLRGRARGGATAALVLELRP